MLQPTAKADNQFLCRICQSNLGKNTSGRDGKVEGAQCLAGSNNTETVERQQSNHNGSRVVTTKSEKNGFTIYRAKDAPGLMEAECMAIAPISDIQRAGLMKALDAGYTKGDEVKVLVDLPGFSLTHAWLKKDYPLALHSHDSDCLYYVVAGSLKLGTEELFARDSFFVPANVPYTYKPGPDGVEVLEFRHATHFDFVNLSKTAAYWDKATQTILDNVSDWETATPPSGGS